MKRRKKLTAAQKAYRKITMTYGSDSGVCFITNVIFNHCANVTKKLNNLIKILDAGFEVRPAQFDMFRIRVDGFVFGIDYLDNPERSE